MRHVLVSTLTVVCIGSSGVSAQSVAQGDLALAVAGVQQKIQTITLDVTDLPLSDVLGVISRRSGVSINYSPAIVPIKRSVSVRVVQVSAEEAVRAALRGTGIGVQQIADGSLLLSPAGGETGRDNGVITGRVLDAKTKRPLAGATVLLDRATSGVTTGADGTFRIEAAAGSHMIHVRYVGFGRSSREVVVDAGQAITLDISLEPNANVLNEVVVTGTVVATERKAIPTPITVITAEEIEKRGITRIEQFLRGEVPGVIALDMGSARYSANGASFGSNDDPAAMVASRVYSRGSADLDGGANPIKTYVDGVELLNPAYLGTIDPQSIDRIEIITGPQAATIYGSGAMGGVMQIFTKKGNGQNRTDITLNMRYGMLQSNLSKGLTPAHNHSVNVTGGLGPDFSYSASVSYGYTGQWQPELFAQTFGASIGATFIRGPLTTSGSVGTTLSKNGTYGQTFIIYPASLLGWASGENGDMSRNPRIPSRRTAGTSTLSNTLNIDYRASSLWQHHLTAGKVVNQFAIQPQAPWLYEPGDTLYHSSRSDGSRLTAAYNMTLVSPSHPIVSSSLTLGANGSWGDQVSFTACTATSNATSYTNCQSHIGGFSYTLQLNRSADDKSYGGFGSWRIGVFDQLYLTLGLRAERNPAYGREHQIDWTPTNGIAWTVEHDQLSIKVLGSYGRATRPPRALVRLGSVANTPGYDPAQYISRFESPDLRPEYSSGPQVGVELYYAGIASMTINRYRQTVKDLIRSIVVDSFFARDLATGDSIKRRQSQYLNAADIRQEGWEGTASLNVGPMALKGTYSWNDSKILSMRSRASSTYYEGRAFNTVPTHFANVTISYALGGSSINIVNNWMGSASRSQGGIGDLEGFISTWEQNNARLRMYTDRFRGSGGVWYVPDYAKIDINVSHRVASWMTATVNILNAGDSYASDGNRYNPTLGRQTQLGISLRPSGLR